MKSYTVGLLSGLAALVSATHPGQYQGQNDYAPGQENYGPVTVTVTETVTETAPPVTITDAVTITQDASYGGQASYNPPPPPPASYGGASSTAPYGSRQTHRVEVGTFNKKLQFVPNQVNAAIGDVVEFDFLANSHSLTQSEFLTPCTYNGGFDTGLNQMNPKNESGLFVIPFEVTTDKPQWFYCKQQNPAPHCNAGMVFGLNPRDKMDQFIQNAINQGVGASGTAGSTAPIQTGASTTAYQTASATATATATATGAVPTVTVGLNNGAVLRFDPPYLPYVAVGQKIHFDFRAVNHTLTESSLEDPCKKLDGTTVDTNFQNANKDDIPEAKPFDLVIDSDKPRFFYCKQANGKPNGHCKNGMVFAVNTDKNTFGLFQQNAMAVPVPAIKGRFRA